MLLPHQPHRYESISEINKYVTYSHFPSFSDGKDRQTFQTIGIARARYITVG
jgi:hypothetical protein